MEISKLTNLVPKGSCRARTRSAYVRPPALKNGLPTESARSPSLRSTSQFRARNLSVKDTMPLLNLGLLSFVLNLAVLSGWAAPQPRTPSQSFLTQQALDDIASRAAPIAGKHKHAVFIALWMSRSLSDSRLRHWMLQNGQDMRLDGTIS